jgi:hypothetical protein
MFPPHTHQGPFVAQSSYVDSPPSKYRKQWNQSEHQHRSEEHISPALVRILADMVEAALAEKGGSDNTQGVESAPKASLRSNGGSPT